MDKFKASCHCGKVKCSFSMPATAVVQCHCQNCRKLQGSDYSTWLAVENKQFTVEKGSEFITHYQANERSNKSFCSLCGTNVYAVNGRHFIGHKMLPLGTVENYSAELKPQMQVYTENKAEWVNIHTDVLIFPEK